MQETQEMRVWSLGREESLEQEKATHSSILAWNIPQTGRLMGYNPWDCKGLDMTEHTHTHMLLRENSAGFQVECNISVNSWIFCLQSLVWTILPFVALILIKWYLPHPSISPGSYNSRSGETELLNKLKDSMMEPHVAQCLRYCSRSGNSWEKHSKVHSPREPCGMWRNSSLFTVRLWIQEHRFHSCLCHYVYLGPHLHNLAFLLLCLQSRQLSHSKFYFSVLGEYEQQLLTSAHLGLR